MWINPLNTDADCPSLVRPPTEDGHSREVVGDPVLPFRSFSAAGRRRQPCCARARANPPPVVLRVSPMAGIAEAALPVAGVLTRQGDVGPHKAEAYERKTAIEL